MTVLEYEAMAWVQQLLPRAHAYNSKCGGGWCIDADTSPIGKPIPHLTFGNKDEGKAWTKAARILGWRPNK